LGRTDNAGGTVAAPRSASAQPQEEPVQRRPRRLTPAAGLLLTCLALAGCVPQGLAFRVDDRLTFVSPEDRSTVSLPVVIDWEVRDVDVDSFAVFVDRAPMPPNETLRWLARKDTTCRADDGCPDQDYLSSRGVYTTTETELVLEQVPRTTDREDRKERHRAVVVLLDSEGRRIGESAFEVAFDVERGAGA
jgi:hypothetical protein